MDGPEKAGKSTLCSVLAREGASIRHWGPVASDAEYLVAIQEDFRRDGLVVWDRGWASESVYSNLLQRDRRLGADPWLGEWLYGRAFAHRIILLGPELGALERLRDGTDLPVDVGQERCAFYEYGRKFRWTVVANKHSTEFAESMATFIRQSLLPHQWETSLLPRYCGPADPRVVVVGAARNERSSFPGAWLPFTTPYTTRLARVLGVHALQCGWTNARDLPTSVLKGSDLQLVVCCGSEALCSLSKLGRTNYSVALVPHPAALYRWGRYKDAIDEVEYSLKSKVLAAFGDR